MGNNWQELSRKLELRYRDRVKYHLSQFSENNRVAMTFGNILPQIDGVILDMGCSDGRTTIEISNMFPKSHVVGIDVLPSVDSISDELKWGNPRYHETLYHCGEGYQNIDSSRISHLVADGYRSPFPNDFFSAVFCMNNLYFLFEAEEPPTIDGIQDLVGTVKPGGYFILSGGPGKYADPQNFVIFRKDGKLIPERVKIESKETSDIEFRIQTMKRIIEYFGKLARL